MPNEDAYAISVVEALKQFGKSRHPDAEVALIGS